LSLNGSGGQIIIIGQKIIFIISVGICLQWCWICRSNGPRRLEIWIWKLMCFLVGII